VHVLNVEGLVILLVIAGVAGLHGDEEISVGGAGADQGHTVEATADHAQEAHDPDHIPAHDHDQQGQGRGPDHQDQEVPTLLLGLLLVPAQNHREKISQTENLLEDGVGVEVGAKADHHRRGVATHKVQVMVENLPRILPITPQNQL